MSDAVTPAPAPPRARRGRPGYDRARVLDVAIQVFIEQGYDATSVTDLAVRLGLTKSSLYHHYDSKEQLLAIALDSALGNLEAVLDRPQTATGPAVDRLRAAIGGAVEVLVDYLPHVTLLLRVRGNSATETDALTRRRRFDQRVTALVAEAQTEGALRSDIDARTATRLIFGMVNSLVEWYRPGGNADRERLVHDVITIALDGLQAH